MPTSFTAFAVACEALRATNSKLEKARLAAEFLLSVAPEERAPAARFLAGRPLSELDPRSLDVGWAVLRKALRGGQRSLFDEPLTIAAVAANFDALADVEGPDSGKRRAQLLKALLGRCNAEERPWLLAILHGEMRTGASDGLVLEALAKASGVEAAVVRRAHMLRGDLGEVALLALGDGGPEALRSAELRLFHPLRPMLAEASVSPAEALAALGGEAAFEHKFDGARIAIHKRSDEVRVFSRRLTDVTASLPEAVEEGLRLAAREAVVEGEAVAYDNLGKPLPFQDLMRRFRRVHGLAEERARIPITLHLFDCLHADGQTLLDASYRERWQRLTQIAEPRLLAPRRVTRDAREADAFLAAALARGHEGLMAKALDSPYVPGKRGGWWLKIKPSVTLDCAIIGAEWGSGRRQDWLSNYHLAVRVPPEDEALLVEPAGASAGPVTRLGGWAMLGKTFKGLTDAEFETLTHRLQGLAQREEAWGFVVRPEVIVEVEYNELQRSPHYVSGFALRFARIKAFREDKGPEDADSLGEVRKIAELQGRTKGRLAESG